MSEPRSIHHKENFCQGNRQKWLIIFLLCGAGILGMDASGHIQKVDSYLTFLTFLSGSFILGYSGTETMKLFTVTSSNNNQTTTIKSPIIEEGSPGAPKTRPFSQSAHQE